MISSISHHVTFDGSPFSHCVTFSLEHVLILALGCFGHSGRQLLLLLPPKVVRMSGTQTDVELGEIAPTRTYLEGYAEFSNFIASDPQLSVYRKYERLAARNLLYLEAEVQLIDMQLQEMDEVDIKILKESQDVGEKKRVEDSARCWDALVWQAKNKEERAVKRLDLILRMRSAINKYGEKP